MALVDTLSKSKYVLLSTYILYLSMFAHGGVGSDQHDAAQQQEEEAQHRGPAL